MTIGKLAMGLGLGLFALGLLLEYCPFLFAWFGRLPGDIRIEEENRFVFFPVVSTLVVSVALTLLFNWLTRK